MAVETTPGTVVLLVRLAKSVHRQLGEERLGMPFRQFLMLSYLRDNSPALQQQACEALLIDPNNCVILLNEMEHAGHILRRRDPTDRRRHVVELTAAGTKALDRAERAQESIEDEVLAGLSAEERATLRALVSRALEPTQP